MLLHKNKTCLTCGKKFQVRYYRSRKNRKYCSRICKNKMQSKLNVGEKSFHWKGGKSKHRSGYLMVRAMGHPMANRNHYILEHRYVMAKHLGRYLDPSEHVHHINGNKTDNRIKNLVIMTNSEHRRSHTIYPNKKCLQCNELVPRHQIRTRKYCSVACMTLAFKGKRFSPETEFKIGHN